jgi:hypothetical protein
MMAWVTPTDHIRLTVEVVIAGGGSDKMLTLVGNQIRDALSGLFGVTAGRALCVHLESLFVLTRDIMITSRRCNRV